MPLATDLLPLLKQSLKHLDEMASWLDDLSARVQWLERGPTHGSFPLNIEQVFHLAYFEIETFRLRQHLAEVGREDGPGTAWNQAQSIGHWLSCLEDGLCDVIIEREAQSDLSTIIRWANSVGPSDSVLSFNYDTLAERSLAATNKRWTHGFALEPHGGIPVFKLHGSVDWISAHRSGSFSKLDLLFDKANVNRSSPTTGSIEDDFRLWRCRTSDQLERWLNGRALQPASSPRSVGIAGLGAYKELHTIPGLGYVWSSALRALYRSDLAIVIGFSMSDFDQMAQLQFADVARARFKTSAPLRVIVIDPHLSPRMKERFERVFRIVEFRETVHELMKWEDLR